MEITQIARALQSVGLGAIKRAGLALTSRPRSAIPTTLLGLASVAALVLPVGISTGFLRTDRPPPPPQRSLRDLGQIFVMPALLEELAFRAVLLPHPSEAPSALRLALSVSGSLVVFVLYHHPLQTWITPDVRPVFQHPAFLTMAAALGAVCTGAYCASGSVWPPALIHWAAVAVWYSKLGGYEKLRRAGYAK